MDEIKKETATSTANEEQMSEEELNNVAGGMTYWYQRSDWMTVKQFKSFKEEKEIQGHTFYEGDANPQA